MKNDYTTAALTALAFLTALFLTACASVQQGSQSAVVRSEQTLSISLAAIDSFLAFEHRRRADVPKEVRDIAARVRSRAVAAFESANRLRIAYKVNRSAANEAGLLTALAVVDALVGEIRVWVPVSSAGGVGVGNLDALVAESQASKSTGSWIALVPVFVDLAREIYHTVNKAREVSNQSAEWNLAQEDEFAARIASLRAAPHWN